MCLARWGLVVSYLQDEVVSHPVHGEGRVVTDLGPTVVVRFDTNLHQVEAHELVRIRSFKDVLLEGTLDGSLGSLAKAQALLIRSINDQWGVFSRSRVRLLPHQLWVCKQVTRTWPTRWLVADDVGLGKTIEAGLILEPLMAGGRVRRLLVLAPARLVPQWRDRLKSMFDIRLQEYSTAQDKGSVSFWETASQVVASFQTLRQERALERLLRAEAWDMVLVDEAHHFQAQERASTLTYNLLRQLDESERISSLVLLTGTPHRGKDFGFLALMQLLRRDLFDPNRDIAEQLYALPQAMIRNNKASVTDLHGNKLFQPVSTESIDYSYVPAEAQFYTTMSEFIIDGRAYAMSLSGRQQTARMLLLVALQKLAASSIAAITRALRGRRAMLKKMLSERLPPTVEDENETLDEAAEGEERRPVEWELLLMSDEINRLDDLINLARTISHESKVASLLHLIDKRLTSDEPLLLFTEYKATQALAYSALEARYGIGCAGFINGDDKLTTEQPDGSERSYTSNRDTAASDFNAGRIRFLISTEAGGEGIDLQERCATLVHLDLPWNPMRLHQRVGRVNRYGQKRPVRVFILRNPDTVEARIWELLEEKLGRIQATLSASMEVEEDITQLVIGMTGSHFFDELFTHATVVDEDGLSTWFDAHTQQFGGQDVVATVRQLVGSVAHYDFQSVGSDIPRLDLPALEPFFRNVMQHLGRRVTRTDAGLSVATPEAWRGSLEFRSRYDGLVFNRDMPYERSLNHLLGMGHPLIDRAVKEFGARPSFLCRVGNLEGPVVLVQVEDEVTGTDATIHRIVLAVRTGSDGSVLVMRDWEALLLLNEAQPLAEAAEPPSTAELTVLQQSVERLEREVPHLGLPFRRPKVNPALAFLTPKTTI